MIRWFANNSIAANFLLVAILLAGIHSALYRIPIQVAPPYEMNGIFISASYRGGTPTDVERDILIPIEQSLRNLSGVFSIETDGYVGRARIWVELEPTANQRVVLEEAKELIGRINTFPSEMENLRVIIPDSDNWMEVLTVAVTGDLSETELLRAARQVQNELLTKDGISQINIRGNRDFEIAIEADHDKLQAYGLEFSDITEAVQRFSVDLPAGSIRTTTGNLTVRTLGQAYGGKDFARIPIRAANGATVEIGEVATIYDGFEEGSAYKRFNGKPGMMVAVLRQENENAIQISKTVHEYVADANGRFPNGMKLYIWDDDSSRIKGRLGTLVSSLIQGCLLVFILLALFLRPSVAFWVVVGIPVSFAGGILLMPILGLSANIMSIFGFIIVLGLVVDDAIVTGENIYTKLKSGMDPLEASVIGTKEVAIPVTFGVITTVVAFLPLLFFKGYWGTLARQIPPVVAPVLIFSLIESKFILPSHLKHLKTNRTHLNGFAKLQKMISEGLETFVQKVYRPSLIKALDHRYAVCSVFIGAALLMIGYFQSGKLGFITIPSVEKLAVSAHIVLPNGSPVGETQLYVSRIADGARQLQKEFTDKETGLSLIKNIYERAGGKRYGGPVRHHSGNVTIELLDPNLRNDPSMTGSEVAKRWKEAVGEIPEARHFSIRANKANQSARVDMKKKEPIMVELRGPNNDRKVEIAEEIEALFESYDEIANASSETERSIDELAISLKPQAAEFQLTQQMLARQIRQAFFGDEAQKVQRDQDQLRVMVRLTKRERETMHTLDTFKVLTPSGAHVSLRSVADVRMVKVPSKIERINGAQTISVRAIPVDESVDILAIAASAAPHIQALVNGGENLSYRYTGYIAENKESKRRTLIGSIALFIALYSLLAIPFKSMIQPIFVLLAVPFGVIGALLGHMVMGVTPSYLSVFGMLALAGVVVNDSLVLVDFINQRRRNGMALRDAITDAGPLRFRAILLTSITTFAGLIPLMFDRSLQGQFLVPMAVSLGYGIIFATGITLYLIPSAYLISDDLTLQLRNLKHWYLAPFRRPQNDS